MCRCCKKPLTNVGIRFVPLFIDFGIKDMIFFYYCKDCQNVLSEEESACIIDRMFHNTGLSSDQIFRRNYDIQEIII